MKPLDYSLKKKFRPVEWLVEKLVVSVATISLLTLMLIFAFIFRESWPVFSGAKDKSVASQNKNAPLASETYGGPAAAANEELKSDSYGDETSLAKAPVSGNTTTEESKVDVADWKNLFQSVWQPVSDVSKYGLIPLFIGSFKVTLVALLISTPLAILAAIYTTAFAPRWAREIMKPAIEILAGFPSVVIGFFALVVLASIIQKFLGTEYRLNAFVGGLAMSLAVIPIIFTITEDALAAVPKVMKEASFALGASKWQTAFFVVLPAATPGVFAAILLGFGRAFGETMIALMATGNAALVSSSFFEPVRTLSATIGAEMAEVVVGDTHYNVLFLIGSLLFIITFGLNAIAEFYVRKKLLKRFSGV